MDRTEMERDDDAWVQRSVIVPKQNIPSVLIKGRLYVHDFLFKRIYIVERMDLEEDIYKKFEGAKFVCV